MTRQSEIGWPLYIGRRKETYRRRPPSGWVWLCFCWHKRCMTKHTEVSFSRRDHMTWHADIKQQTCSCENTARWLLVKCAFYVNCLVQWYFARAHTPSKLMNYDVTANTESRGAHVQLAHSCTCTQTRVMKAHRQIKQNDMKKMITNTHVCL